MGRQCMYFTSTERLYGSKYINTKSDNLSIWEYQVNDTRRMFDDHTQNIISDMWNSWMT